MNGILLVFLWEVVVPPFFVLKMVDFGKGVTLGVTGWRDTFLYLA